MKIIQNNRCNSPKTYFFSLLQKIQSLVVSSDVSTSRKGHFSNMVITNIPTIWASHSINRCKPSKNSANSLKSNKNIAYIKIHHTTSCASGSILWHSWHYAHNMVDHVHHYYIIQHHVHHRAFNHIIDKILSTWNIMLHLVHHRASYHINGKVKHHATSSASQSIF